MLACKLIPKSPFHFGIREGWMEGTEVFLHSDTLFSAFFNSYLLLYGEERLKGLLEEFLKGAPPFIFSSAFPFWEEKYYFPIPRNFFPREKDLKKARFVEKKGFESFLRGVKEDLEEKTAESFDVLPTFKGDSPYAVHIVPHVSLDALAYSSTLFHSSNLFFREGAGLFFLIQIRQPDLKNQILAVLRLMGDEGIGGDRSSGCGGFWAEIREDFNIDYPPDGEALCLLSLCFPGENDLLNLENGYFELLERKGYAFSPEVKSIRKRSVRMLQEGSVFKTKCLEGKILDITPQGVKTPHPIFRCGLAFTVPCKWRENENQN